MARKRSPALTDAEARVMSVLWQRQNRNRRRCRGGVATRTCRHLQHCSDDTAHPRDQGDYVTHEKVAPSFGYQPAVDARQARQRALRHLVARLFNGSPSLLILNVLEDERKLRRQLKRLKKLIEDA